MIINSTKLKDINQELFKQTFEKDGFVVVEGVFSEEFVEEMIPDLESAIEEEARFHGTTEYKDYGMLLACPIYGGKFLEVPGHEPFIKPFDWILGSTSIIYVYTSSCMPPDKGNYSSRIHVDRPHYIPGYTEAMGSLILLNDFTLDNGATYILPGSHVRPDEPREEEFYKNAVRLVAPRGSVIYFHLRLWHAGGVNLSGNWRHCLGIGMIRPGMKQRIDLPRAMKDTDISQLSELALQKLGFFSQPPISLEEYYAPKEQRTYKQTSEWDV